MMDKILYGVIVVVLTVFSWLPLRVHYLLSDVLYFIVYKVLGYRVSTVVTNISRSFPHADYKKIDKLTREYYHAMCDTIVEAVWAHTRSRERVAELIDFEGCDVLNDVYGEGRSVMVLLGHQFNWEIYTHLPDLKRTYGLKMDNEHFFFIYKKMSNKVSDMVIRHLREKNGGCILVEKNNIVRHILQKKSEGGIYYFMADQYPDKGAGMDFELLGQPTRVYNGVELLARRLSMPVVYISVQRLGRGRYRSEYVKICDDACATPEGYVTREYVKLLEESINVSRSTWLWSHRRWKNIKV